MIPFVVYDGSGRILRTGRCPAGWLAAQAGADEAVLEGQGTDHDHYIDLSGPPAIRSRAAMAEQLTQSGRTVTLTGLPQPCTVTVEGVVYLVTEGELRIEFSYPGRYALRLDSLPYLTRTRTVDIP